MEELWEEEIIDFSLSTDTTIAWTFLLDVA